MTGPGIDAESEGSRRVKGFISSCSAEVSAEGSSETGGIWDDCCCCWAFWVEFLVCLRRRARRDWERERGSGAGEGEGDGEWEVGCWWLVLGSGGEGEVVVDIVVLRVMAGWDLWVR